MSLIPTHPPPPHPPSTFFFLRTSATWAKFAGKRGAKVGMMRGLSTLGEEGGESKEKAVVDQTTANPMLRSSSFRSVGKSDRTASSNMSRSSIRPMATARKKSSMPAYLNTATAGAEATFTVGAPRGISPSGPSTRSQKRASQRQRLRSASPSSGLSLPSFDSMGTIDGRSGAGAGAGGGEVDGRLSSLRGDIDAIYDEMRSSQEAMKAALTKLAASMRAGSDAGNDAGTDGVHESVKGISFV